MTTRSTDRQRSSQTRHPFAAVCGEWQNPLLFGLTTPSEITTAGVSSSIPSFPPLESQTAPMGDEAELYEVQVK